MRVWDEDERARVIDPHPHPHSTHPTPLRPTSPTAHSGEFSHKQADIWFFCSEMAFICLEIAVYHSENRLKKIESFSKKNFFFEKYVELHIIRRSLMR